MSDRLLAAGGWAWPADLQPLLLALRRHRFSVELGPPPRRGVYGMFDAARRTIWMAPITGELGIARQTLLHRRPMPPRAAPMGCCGRSAGGFPSAP